VFAAIARMSGLAFEPAVAALCGHSQVREAMVSLAGTASTVGRWRKPARWPAGRSPEGEWRGGVKERASAPTEP
jgi:hypothetical protein